MLRFFRRIRQKLIASGSVTKYLLYAAGEIALVMIGILLALQVSNWNQELYESGLEEKYLEELLEDFKANKESVDRVIRIMDDAIPTMTYLLEQSALQTPEVPLDTLNAWFSEMNAMPTFWSTDRAYINITGSGELKIISNDDVKYALARYYTRLEVVKLVQNTHELELVNTFQPYIIEHLDFQSVSYERLDDLSLPKAVDKDAILEVLHTRKFRNVITTKWTILTDLLNQYREIRINIMNVLRVLEEEVADS